MQKYAKMVKLLKLKIREKIKGYARVLKIAKKPDLGEFSESLKICLMGLAVVGIVGFIVYLISILFLG